MENMQNLSHRDAGSVILNEPLEFVMRTFDDCFKKNDETYDPSWRKQLCATFLNAFLSSDGIDEV